MVIVIYTYYYFLNYEKLYKILNNNVITLKRFQARRQQEYLFGQRHGSTLLDIVK